MEISLEKEIQELCNELEESVEKSSRLKKEMG